MDSEPTVPIPVVVRDGIRVHIETASIGGRQKVSILDSVPIDDLMRSVEAIAATFRNTLKAIRPTKGTVEFGVEVAVEAGKLVAVICQGSAKANFKVILEWKAEPHTAAPPE